MPSYPGGSKITQFSVENRTDRVAFTMQLASTRYSLIRRPADDAANADTLRIGRIARGSISPCGDRPGAIRQQSVGGHELHVQRDGGLVTIALPGALRLRGRPDEIRALAAALMASLES